jgi:4-amino-4-deoxy-L-arabinose transferase-like glycosyltransferase
VVELLQNPEILNKPIFVIACFLLLVSAIFFMRGKQNLALAFLLLGAAALRVFMALLDPYLNFWDEQYHALVARNLIENPLNPALIPNPAVPLDKFIWTENQVWLHKQPLFLWQMALSLKLWGFNEFALRLPSILMSLLVVLLIYRMGQISLNRNTGYFAAFLFGVAYYPLELMVGAVPTDHNDTAFIFYVTASLWALTEYQNKKDKKWLLLIGIFSGAAILVKWLVGLLVYAGWGALTIVENKFRPRFSQFLPLLQALLVTVIIALPWQLYIFWKFPAEAAFEYAHAAAHFSVPVEGHGGNILYHFQAMEKVYGLSPFVVLAALALLLALLKKLSLKVFFGATFFTVYIFYSLAQTKMPAFGLITSSIVFLAIGGAGAWVMEKLNFPAGRIVAVAMVFAVAYFAFDFKNLQKMHSSAYGGNELTNRAERIENTKHFKILSQYPLQGRAIFNCKHAQHIPARFYTGLEVYDVFPDESQLMDLKANGRKIAVFKDSRLPAYLADDRDVFIIPLELE